ncbi:MAG TPA: hypothetical protein PLL69_07360 [Gemmatimonadales bacterium]|nr:hypothetical protein [Gemmatimonadales bacterium]
MIVQNHRPAWGEGEGWRVSEEPVLVIADTVATGDGRYLIDADRLSNGDVVVLTDEGGRWFDGTGVLRRGFAVNGEGPGEFRYASQLRVLPGDTVAVFQGGPRGKMALFAHDGSLAHESLTDTKRRAALGRWGECRSLLLPDLSWTECDRDTKLPPSRTNRSSFDGDGDYVGPGPGLLRELRRIQRLSPALDTAFPLGIDIGIEQQIVVLHDDRMTSIGHPYHAQTHMAAGGTPMRIAIATNPHWEIELWTPDGRLTHRIRRDDGRRTPTPAESLEAVSLIEDSDSYYIREEPGVTREELERMLEWPDSLPGHSGLVVSNRGELLSRREPFWVASAPSTFDVLDADGGWLGSLALPARFRLLRAGDDYLLGVQFDDDDVPSVVVYGLER